MADIALSSGARSTLLSLTSMQAQIDALQNRLASGKKVNSPLDNPTAYFTAANLSARAGLLDGLTSSLVNAHSTIDAANNGIAAIRSLLASAKTVANQALQSAPDYVTVTGTNSNALSTSSTIASSFGSSTRFRNGDSVTVSDGTTTATYIAASGDTVQTFLNAINNTAGLKVTASLNASGQIALAAGDAVDVTVGASMAGSGGATLTSVVGLTAGTTAYTPDATRQNLATQFNDLMTQIDLAAQDAGFNGLNLLTGSSLSVTLNESGSSSVTVAGADLTASGLGLAAAGGGFQSDSEINAALDAVTDATAKLETTSTTFGSMGAVMQARQDFNSAMMDTLNGGADALTVSDVNEDSAMLLALQTRQQIAATALSLTQDADSAVLSLFGVGRD
jgi:flagellin-like hook-associated protein FlgL